jgi:hypothetical protein
MLSSKFKHFRLSQGYLRGEVNAGQRVVKRVLKKKKKLMGDGII